jgi:hypothetical protein
LSARPNSLSKPHWPRSSASATPPRRLRLLGEATGDAARDGHWLCADPVHLRFHHERILADAGASISTTTKPGSLAGTQRNLRRYRRLPCRHPRRWYLRLHQAVDHPVDR